MKAIGLLLILVLTCVRADALERKVKLEWDANSDAESYELEMGNKGSSKPFNSLRELKEPRWSGTMSPGKYWMRVRGRDDRDLPGEWSEPIEFQVKLGFADIQYPKNQEIITLPEGSPSLELKWEPVESAKGYAVVVMKDNGEVVETRKTTQLKMNLNLNHSMKYVWFVQALDESGNTGERPQTPNEFIVEGPTIETPHIKKPETQFIRGLEFERPKEAQVVKMSISRFDTTKKDWVSMGDYAVKKGNAIKFLSKWPGGRYQFIAVAEGKYRKSSLPSEIYVDVAKGDRSIAAENRVLIKKSIERTDGWFATANYIIAKTDYVAKVVEENSSTSLSALTGTLRLGTGKFWEESPFGFAAHLDYGGIVVDGKTTYLMGTEVQGLYRLSAGERNETRFKLGLSYQQIPEVTNILPKITMGTFAAMAPTAGVEYWHSFSRRMAMQLSGGVKYNMNGTTTRGAKIQSTMSFNAGVQGGYIYQPGLTGLFGYVYKSEKFLYPGTNASLQATGTNEIAISGHFLQLSVEYDF